MIVKDKAQISQIPAKKIKWFRTKLKSWAKNNLRDYPWRNTSEPYNILVAEFLLQRTDADTVEPVYQTFLTHYPTLDKLANANLEDIAAILQPLGLFFRAERLWQTAKIIYHSDAARCAGISPPVVEDDDLPFGAAGFPSEATQPPSEAKSLSETLAHSRRSRSDRQIPSSEPQLLKLPGIGIYTARAICSQAFNQPVAVMDTNVARILERFFNIKGERVKSRCKILWCAAETIAPKTKVGLWNLSLLDFGALICTARNPKCHECTIARQCCWFLSKK